jgi:hypothetical protein
VNECGDVWGGGGGGGGGGVEGGYVMDGRQNQPVAGKRIAEPTTLQLLEKTNARSGHGAMRQRAGRD